ncbi:MAG: hypothetical protein EBT93_13065 [Alphaproteobacteria bacterium]|nr:hypothetical protein [Alphaproteobacteria bacterium]
MQIVGQSSSSSSFARLDLVRNNLNPTGAFASDNYTDYRIEASNANFYIQYGISGNTGNILQYNYDNKNIAFGHAHFRMLQ